MTQAAAQPAFITDLDYEKSIYAKVGLQEIGGNRYPHSFTLKICYDPDVAVPLPAGYRNFTAAIGFTDDSSTRPGDIKISLEYTTDARGIEIEDSSWITLETVDVPVKTRSADLKATFPEGDTVTAIRFGGNRQSCGNAVVVGDAAVS